MCLRSGKKLAIFCIFLTGLWLIMLPISADSWAKSGKMKRGNQNANRLCQTGYASWYGEIETKRVNPSLRILRLSRVTCSLIPTGCVIV